MRALILIPLAMLIAVVKSQIPSFGGCPDHPAIKNFEREQFFGTWYEIERYFTVSELAAKCITATYEKRPDGKVYINNSYTNRFTGVKRIISGQMKLIGKTENEGLYNVRYSALPVAYDTTLKVLDTDYETYAVVWSCSSVGPFGHTESVWVMGREREPAGEVLQRIYGVLDKFKINRTFFVESDQKGCETLAPPVEAIDPTPPPIKSTANKKKKGDKFKLEIIPNTEPAKVMEIVEEIDVIVPVNALKTEKGQIVDIVETPIERSQPIEEHLVPARIIDFESESDVSKIEAFVPSTKLVKPSEVEIKESTSSVGALKSGIDREAVAEAVKAPIAEVIKEIVAEKPVEDVVQTVKLSVPAENKKQLVTKKLISTRRITEKTENTQHIPVTIVST